MLLSSLFIICMLYPDICSCSPAFEGMAILQDICVVVNRNDDKSPCVCTLDSGCMVGLISMLLYCLNARVVYNMILRRSCL